MVVSEKVMGVNECRSVEAMVVSEKVIKRLTHMGINEATLYAVQLARGAEEPRKVLDELWERSRGAFDYSTALEDLGNER